MTFKHIRNVFVGAVVGFGAGYATKAVLDYKEEENQLMDDIESLSLALTHDESSYEEALVIEDDVQEQDSENEDINHGAVFYEDEIGDIKDLFKLDYINSLNKRDLMDIQGMTDKVADEIIKQKPFYSLSEVKAIKDVPEDLFAM